ncbi:hypothetical protein LXA43DRAFT_1069176 [Ganoderma leucocontextum]|nr:hypothetical protein LXA43DRAFT_1069176 [Ganoderma leucocontextum]
MWALPTSPSFIFPTLVVFLPSTFSMPNGGDALGRNPSVVFATDDADLAFGRGGATGNGAWRSVRVVIAELSRHKYGVVVADIGSMAAAPILSCVVDEGLMYEANEFHRMINLAFCAYIRVVHSADMVVTLRFHQPLQFHDCLRTLAEAKSLITHERACLLEELDDVYAQQFPPPVTSGPPTLADADMDDVMASPPTSPTSPTALTAPPSPTSPKAVPTASANEQDQDVPTAATDELPAASSGAVDAGSATSPGAADGTSVTITS